ncbi:MAG: hypothetical protein R2695_05685 [Acidimicrobiales bacterium]
MTEQRETPTASTARERELEIEVARLKAEVDALKGEDPVAATSRFLAMAADTVDRVVADARREADEIVEEISAQAEARRDEARGWLPRPRRSPTRRSPRRTGPMR